VLELGKYLVEELGLQDSNNTLGRWIAHHVAELMAQIEKTKDKRIRREAEERAFELIVKLWSMREVLPAGANPIKKYDEALKGFRQLAPPDRPWARVRGSERQDLAIRVYDSARRLAIGILLLDIPDDALSFAKADRVSAFLSPAETKIVKQLKQALFEVTEEPSLRVRFVSAGAPATPNVPAATDVPSRVLELLSEVRGMCDDVEKLVPKLNRESADSPIGPGISIAVPSKEPRNPRGEGGQVGEKGRPPRTAKRR